MATTGIPNLGNTCYASTCLQCLKRCKSFVQLVRVTAPKRPLFELLSRFLAMLDAAPSDINVLSMTRALYQRLGTGFEQGDVHEFMLNTIDVLDKDIGIPKSDFKFVEKKRSIHDFMDHMWDCYASLKGPVESLFSGQFALLSICEGCQHASLLSDTFTCMHLGREGLQGYMTCETIEGIECDRCQRRTTRKKMTRLYRAPTILLLLFDRSPETIDVVLDVAPYTMTGSSVKYQLRSAACHFGSLSYGGHYIALCREEDGRWTAFNDSQARPVTEPGMLLSRAYMLVYERLP